MKKISFSLLAIFALILSFTFTGCGNGTDPDDPKDTIPDDPKKETYDVSYIAGVYYGQNFVSGAATYIMDFTSGDVAVGESITGTGAIFEVMVITDASLDAFPAAGTYDITDISSGTLESVNIAAAGFENQGSYMGCYVTMYEDGEEVETFLLSEGTVTISGTAAKATVSLDALDEDGTAYKFTEEGAMELYNMPYGFEKQEAITATAKSTTTSAQYFNGQGYAEYAFNLSLDNGYNSTMISMLVEGNPGSDVAQLAGTYPVSFALQPGIVVASDGFDGQSIWPSFIGKGEGQNLTEMYFIIGGSMTIAADGAITAKFETYNGSTFNITADGGYTISQGRTSSAPAARALNIAQEQARFPIHGSMQLR